MDREKLFHDNIKLAYQFSKKYQGYYGREDAIQISLMGFWIACKTFDPSKGIKLSSYAYKVMSNQFFVINRKSKKEVVETVSLDNIIGDNFNSELINTISDGIDYEDMYLNNIILDSTIKFAKNNLNKTDYSIFEKYFLKNISQMDIAKDLNVSQANISRVILKIRKILKRGMGYE